MEMCGADYVTAIAAIGDSKKGLKHLKKALLEIDKIWKNLEKSAIMSLRLMFTAAMQCR